MKDQLPQAVLNKVSSDKFLLVFEIPNILKTDELINRNSVQYSVQGTVVPEIVIPSLVLPYAGQSLKVSSHAREPYEDISVTFKIDNKFLNWYTIYKWLDLLNDDELAVFNEGQAQGNAEYLRKYQTNFTIYPLDEYNQKIMEFTYTKCYPTKLDRIEYDFQNKDEVRSGFTFSFSQFIAKPMNC